MTAVVAAPEPPPEWDGASPSALIALAFIATAATPHHGWAHVASARGVGATQQQIDHALDLMAAQQAAAVQTIPTTGRTTTA